MSRIRNAVAFAASHSEFVSEPALWREFNPVVDRHSAREAQRLMRNINMRHEHRCCGPPR